jgi:Carboxypeptidase regulatory-like domain
VAIRGKVLSMKRAAAGSILLLISLAIIQPPAGGTTCIPVGKTLKVKEVCGRVTNPLNQPVAGAEVELLNAKSEVFGRVLADDRGDFTIPNVPKGNYKIRVQSAGFTSAAQEIIVTRSNRNTRCNKPIQVLLQLASGCSSISK